MPAAIGKLSDAKIGPWKGMNEKVSPDTLPPDVAADLQNVLLDETPGTVEKRQGSLRLTALPSGLPPRDTYVFTKLDGTSYLLISDGSNLYYTTDPAGAYPAAIKTGLTSSGFMQFETAGNTVWMTNGVDAVMAWDGSTLLIYDRAYTSTTNLTTVDSTHIIHAGLTASDDYWNGMKLVFTAGTNVGTVVTVTDYVEATKTLTFTPAVAGIAATDRFKVGVIIPKGAATRFWDGHLFMACTADNQAELRFSELSDPDTGALMTLDNPRAWPSANELALNVLDQERIFGLSPILRDRVLVSKAAGLWRLERDPLTIYRLEAISRTIGSRFPDTWAEKKNLLYFFGQDKDNSPEIYKTDMVDVTPVDPDGGIEPTLRDLQQPNQVFESRAFTTTADFDAGTKSTLAGTDGGALAVSPIGSGVDPTGDALVSASNVDMETTPGTVTLLGVPVFDVRYEAVAEPDASTPLWVVSRPGNVGTSIVGGVWHAVNGAPSGAAIASRSNVLDSTKDTLLCTRMKGSDGYVLSLYNGVNAIGYEKVAGTLYKLDGGSATAIQTIDAEYHTFHLLLKSTGAYKLWIDGALADSGTTPILTAQNLVRIGMFEMFTINGSTVDLGNNATMDVDFMYYHADFKGDKLSSQGGKVLPITMPDTLPAAGNAVWLNDHSRVPDALLKLWQTSTLHAGTVGLESWTASVSDFSSGTDGAGYLATANGAAPTSSLLRYQRLRATLTRSDYGQAPEMTALYAGTLWVSPSIQLGAQIKLWRTFLDTITTPAGVTQTIKVRKATVTTTPGESDFGAWFTVVNGDNIGTALGDSTPPAARWLQIKVEQGPSNAGLLPIIDALLAQWTTGTAAVLPVRAVVHKKRYWVTAASSGAAANDKIVVCDRNDQWTKFAGLALSAMVHFKSAFYGLGAGDAYVSLLDVEGVYDDNGTAIDAYLVTREESLGAGHLRKNLRYSYLLNDRTGAAWALTTSYRRNGDAAFTGSGTFSMGVSGLDIRQNFPIATVGKRIQRKFANAVVGENMALMGEVLYFDIRGPQP
jgi:hypothetical protein